MSDTIPKQRKKRHWENTQCGVVGVHALLRWDPPALRQPVRAVVLGRVREFGDQQAVVERVQDPTRRYRACGALYAFTIRHIAAEEAIRSSAVVLDAPLRLTKRGALVAGQAHAILGCLSFERQSGTFPTDDAPLVTALVWLVRQVDILARSAKCVRWPLEAGAAANITRAAKAAIRALDGVDVGLYAVVSIRQTHALALAAYPFLRLAYRLHLQAAAAHSILARHAWFAGFGALVAVVVRRVGLHGALAGARCSSVSIAAEAGARAGV